MGEATSMTSKGEPVGHYTQVVWKDSTKLGCGKGRATVGGIQGDLWVCQYGTAGNTVGEFSQQVKAPIKSWSECGGTSADVPNNFPQSFGSPSGSTSGISGSNSGTSGSNSGTSGSNSGTSGSTSGTSGSTSGTAGSTAGALLGGMVKGKLTLRGVDSMTFCKSKTALEGVEAGIAERAGVLQSSVGAWCDTAIGRRMNTVVKSATQDTIVEFMLQVPLDKDANAISAALLDKQQELVAAINKHLEQGTPFQIEVAAMATNALARQAGGSMEATAEEVGSVDALHTLKTWLTVPAVVGEGAHMGKATALMCLAVLMAGGVAMLGVRRRQGSPLPSEEVQE